MEEKLASLEHLVISTIEVVEGLVDRLTALTIVNAAAFTALAEARALDVTLIRDMASSATSEEIEGGERQKRVSAFVDEIIGKVRKSVKLTVIEGGKGEDESTS